MGYDDTEQWKIAGINHQAWLLECTKDGVDLYPEIAAGRSLHNRASWTSSFESAQLRAARDAQGVLSPETKRHTRSLPALQKTGPHGDMVRLELMRRFGYYITESSEHNAEYTPYFIKSRYPELIERFNIPLDEYPAAASIRFAIGRSAATN